MSPLRARPQLVEPHLPVCEISGLRTYAIGMRRQRITVTVEPEVAAAGAAAVAQGRAESVSAWVNLAMTERAAKDSRLAALAAAVQAYEAEHGVITDEERAQQTREDRDAAARVRATHKRRRGAT